jgi:hypothetical protein
MKSFIFALLLLLSVSLFVTVNAVKTVSRIDQMLAIADDLPKNEADFISANGTADKVNALISLWDKEFPSIVCTAGYENTNRCDEAIGALAVHFQNRNGADFSVALSEFCDSLSRLRILEGIHWQGIF